MTRKEWLQKFLDLADQNRPAREFRLKLNIGFNVLSKHVASIPQYRKELADLIAEATEAVAPAMLLGYQAMAIASGNMPLPFTCVASS